MDKQNDLDWAEILAAADVVRETPIIASDTDATVGRLRTFKLPLRQFELGKTR